MKMDKSAYNLMQEYCKEWLPCDKVQAYRTQLQADHRVKDIDRRLRWDIFWTVFKHSSVLQEAVIDLTNNHIDTALRRLMHELYPEVNNLQ